jgi:SAM-dependent methyltransferase
VKQGLLQYLVCPECGGELGCRVERVEGREIVDGTLDCIGCRTAFPVRGGVPRIRPSPLSSRESATATAFGTQWKLLGDLTAVFREEFDSYLHPLTATDLKGLVVLDAGCGMGKFSVAAAEAGATTVIAVDLSDAVDVAHAYLGRFPDAHVVQASIYALPFRPGTFDFAFSIGVLHHLPDPERGFRGIVTFVRSGGRALAWVYAHEGNEFFVRWLDPWRARLFSRLPSIVNRAVATVLAAPLWALIRVLYVPLGRRGRARRLPYAEYFLYFARLGFSTFWGTVYDKLVPPVSFYLRGDEMRRWIAAAGLTDVVLRHRNGNSWSCLARRPSSG